MRPSKKIIAPIVLLAFLLALAAYFLLRPDANALTLYGNVDSRHVELAFTDTARVAKIFVEEGAVVEAGEPLAELDTRRLEDAIAAARARALQAQNAYLKLKNGTRPEEVDQAKAAVAAAAAEVAFTSAQFERMSQLSKESSGRAISTQELDEARLKRDVARAKLNLEQKALTLAEIGARDEDKEAAHAVFVEQNRALDALTHQLEDATLKSPARAVVFRRLLEPGDVATPQRAAFSLSVVSPKWVRAYIAEPDLGRVALGMKARILSDSFPDDAIEGDVTFIASTAEFTPKTVQTTDLRTALVYEIRITTPDEKNKLRLGQPVTVTFSH